MPCFARTRCRSPPWPVSPRHGTDCRSRWPPSWMTGSPRCRPRRRACCAPPRCSAEGSRSLTWPWLHAGRSRTWLRICRRRWRPTSWRTRALAQLAFALLADILDVLRGASVPVNDGRVPGQAEELSTSELKVLRYLPTNLSRPEIAAELSVSVNTVSTHIRSIYAKLGADDRSAAVRRARELRLLAAVRS